jgi:hypothetical protein
VRAVAAALQEARHRRDVDDRAGTPLDHRQDGGVGEPQDHPDQEIELLLLFLDRVGPERLLRPETGVVHQHLDRSRPEPLLDDGELLRHGQIRREHLTGDAVQPADLGRDLLEPRLIPRHQHEVVALDRQLVRERPPDSRGGPSDECRRHSSVLP